MTIKGKGPTKKGKIKNVKISFIDPNKQQQPSTGGSTLNGASEQDDDFEQLYLQQMDSEKQLREQSHQQYQQQYGTHHQSIGINEEEEDEDGSGEEDDEEGEEDDDEGEEGEEGADAELQAHRNQFQQPMQNQSLGGYSHVVDPSSSHQQSIQQPHNGVNNRNDHYISDAEEEDGEEEEEEDGEEDEDDEEDGEEDGEEEEEEEENDDLQLSPNHQQRYMNNISNEDISFGDAMKSPGDMSSLDVSDSSLPHYHQTSHYLNGAGGGGNKFVDNDDHSEIFAAYRPDNNTDHVAGAGFAVAKALKSSTRQDD